MNILLIDNYDSFTFNLVEEFRRVAGDVRVHRNDLSVNRATRLISNHDIDLLVLSPGPGTPEDAGNSLAFVNKFLTEVPIFGVCLGEQCIVRALGGTVGPAKNLQHGKSSAVSHDGRGLFRELENPFRAGRYHSLSAQDLPPDVEVSARSDNGVIMGIRHREHPVSGVQFHPESILTPQGPTLIENLVRTLSPHRNINTP